jgi:hypothetical protein
LILNIKSCTLPKTFGSAFHGSSIYPNPLERASAHMRERWPELRFEMKAGYLQMGE